MTDMSKQLVIGIGTGRCGTKSLTRLLSAQPSASVTHETTPTLAWAEDSAAFGAKVKNILERKADLVGDTAFYHLPYVPQLLSEHPTAKVVCLKRDRKETVRSFLAWTEGTHRWLVSGNGKYKHDGWDKCYPKYDIEDREEACRRYWDEYYARADELASRHADRFRIWETDVALNTRAGMSDLLSFVGVPVDNQVLKLEIHENQGKPSKKDS